MPEEDLREQLYASYKNRAMMYYYIFEELRKELGDDKAAEIMKRGIYNRGVEIGKKYASFSPKDLEGLKEAWQEAGLGEQEIARMCDIAAVVDYGTFEGAGFRFSAETWQPGHEGCCLLKIRPGK